MEHAHAMKVAQLTDAELDHWVALAEDVPPLLDYSSNGHDGVAIIERDHIELSYEEEVGLWWAKLDDCIQSGRTALTAAMRVRVAHKYGETVPGLASRRAHS